MFWNRHHRSPDRARRGMLVVDHGRVACPRKGSDIDVDLCWSCPALQDVSRTGDELLISCKPQMSHHSLGGWGDRPMDVPFL